MKNFVLLFLLFIYTGLAMAQSDSCYSFSGNITDGETGKGFQFATIFIKEIEKGAVADESGRFTIDQICRDKITVQYSALGYKTLVVSYKLAGKISDKIILHTDTCELESVTVYGKKPEELESLSKSSLTGKRLESTRGLSLGEALKEIPGVSSFKTGTNVSKPVIHGLHSNRVLLLNAGLRQEGQQWGNEHAPEIDPFVSDNLVVVKGAAGVRYGSDAIAGVIIVEPRPLPNVMGINAEINMAGMSNNRQGTVSSLLEGYTKLIIPLKWRIQGTWNKGGNVKTPKYFQANTGFEEYNFSYSVSYTKKWFSADVFYSQFNTTLGIFSGAHIGSLKDLETAIKRSEPSVKSYFSYHINRPYQHVEHELTRAKLTGIFRGIGKVNLILGRQFNDRAEFDVRSRSSKVIDENQPQLNFKLTTHSADLVYETPVVKNLSASLGTSYIRQGNVWTGRFLIPNFINNSYGAFFLGKWNLENIEIEAGYRYDIKQLNVYLNNGGVISNLPYNFSNSSGIVGGAIRLNEKINLRANVGSTWRAPNVNELFSNGLHHGAAAIENGNNSLKPETAFKYISSLDLKTRKTSAEISLFYSRIKDFIYLKPDLQYIQTIRGAFPSFTYTQTNADFYGADFYFNYKLSENVRFGGKGSLVFAKNVKDHQYLINIPPVNYSPSLTYYSHFIPKKYNTYIKISLHRTEYQNRIPQNADYALPPAAYTLYDAEVGSDLTFKNQTIGLIFQVNNIFDYAYRDYMNRFRYFTDEPGRNFTFRIKIPLKILTSNKPE